MKSLIERRADRATRIEQNSVIEGAKRDDLQAAAEAAVLQKDTAAGLQSAPLATQEAGGKVSVKPAANKKAVKSPFGN